MVGPVYPGRLHNAGADLLEGSFQEKDVENAGAAGNDVPGVGVDEPHAGENDVGRHICGGGRHDVRYHNKKKQKFLNLYDLQTLLKNLNLSSEINWDWFFLLIAKTGLRFAEALALTPEDFDFEKQCIVVNKSWNYKEKEGHFQPTKNASSNRSVMVDWQLMQQFKSLIANKVSNKPIFFEEGQRVYNSTLNKKLTRYCEELGIPTISIHGLRHTHASLLLYEGVSVASVAKRLGHNNTTTTQETYIHIIKELENKDNDKILHHLSQLR